jgi:hypothetical protein
VAHCDEYGSVIAFTDASGTVFHTACYGPNGQDWGATGANPTPFAWLGGHGVQQVAVSDHIGPSTSRATASTAPRCSASSRPTPSASPAA